MLYAGLRLFVPEVGEAAGSLMALIGLFAVLRWGRGIRGGGALWLLLAVIVVQLISWCLGYLHHPEWMTDNPQLDRLAKWFLFIGLAWWLGGSTRATLLAWALAVAGLVAVVFLLEDSLAQWRLGLQGVRAEFAIRNSQHDSMLFGSALLGLLCFAGRCWRGQGAWGWCRRLLWAAALVTCLVGVVITQTRAAWLALLLVLPLLPLAAWRGAGGRLSRKSWLGLAAAGLVILAGVASFHHLVTDRLSDENRIIAQALDGDWKSIPYSSVGNRLLTWRASLDWIAERPLVGWGENGRSLVIDHTDWLPDKTKELYGHLHNTFLEILVGYGALGLVVVLALIAWIGLGTWHAWRERVMPGDMALFGAAFFVFFAIVSQFESYSTFWTGAYVQNLVAGGLVTHIWRWQKQSGRRIVSWPSRG